MAFTPRTVDEIYESLKSNLTSKISRLTNFATTSFNYVWTQAFSNELREKELQLAAAKLAGLVEYSGGDVTEDNLDDLGWSDNVDPDDINPYLEDEDLEEFVKLVGVTRSPGIEATGTVEFTTVSGETTIPEGTEVGTQPDTFGNYLSFVTTEEVDTGVGTTTVNANIEASEVGDEYNVGSGTVTYLPNPPTGVQSVTNASAITGGTNEQTNDELREEAKNAVLESSGGGTTTGLEGYVTDNTNASSAIVEEKFTGDAQHGQYPHGHVIVDGGTDNDVEQAIDEGKPASVEHFLIRPTIYGVSITAALEGTDISTTRVSDDLDDYIGGLGLGDDVYNDKIIQTIMNSDADIENIDSLTITLVDDQFYFDSQVLDDFEDNDITIERTEWGDWSGDTGSFSSQTGTTISGTYTGELASSNASVSVSTTRTSSTDRSVSLNVQIDNQTGNASDDVIIQILDGGTSLGSLEFRGDGNVYWNDGADNNLQSWSASTTYDVTFNQFRDSNNIRIGIDGTAYTQSLENSVAQYDEISVANVTTGSGGTVNAYIDDIYTSDTVYNLSKGVEMENDGVVEVDGTSGGGSVTFTEDTDYVEIDTDADSSDDSIEWYVSGTIPDIDTGQTVQLTYDDSQDEYLVDEAMVIDGIESVVDEQSNTYTEDTDFQEIDTNADGRHDGIDWSIAGSTPQDGDTFTVTYTTGTSFLVDYDIIHDITIDTGEKASPSSHTITVV